MSDNFCFPVELCEGDKIALFQSPSGEDYVVNYVVTKLDEIVLSMEWITLEKKFVKVELFTANFQLISSQAGVANKNQVCFKFCTDPINRHLTHENERNLMLIITVIPYLDMHDYSVLSGVEDILNVSDENVTEFSEDLLQGLAIDMRDLLIHGDLSDCMIRTDSDEVKVHAAILSARSPVFRRLFKNPAHQKVIEIPSTSIQAVKDMVIFIYSGLIKIKDHDRAKELYKLAYEYQLQDLHDACSVYMSNCKTDHVLETLILAEKHRDDQLKKTAISFILENLAKLKSSKKWASFAENNADLISEIYSAMNRDALSDSISRLSIKK